MKSRIVIFILASCLLMAAVAVAAARFESSMRANGPSESSFELAARGHAHDAIGERDVDLFVEGKARGRTTGPMILVVESGNVDVEGYGTFSVIGLHGELIQQQHHIHLVIKITPLYGGKIAVWNLMGDSGDWGYNDIISITLSSVHVTLPQDATLDDLALTGTATLD